MAEMRTWRSLTGYTKLDNKTNTEMYEKLKVNNVVEEIEKQHK